MIKSDPKAFWRYSSGICLRKTVPKNGAGDPARERCSAESRPVDHFYGNDNLRETCSMNTPDKQRIQDKLAEAILA